MQSVIRIGSRESKLAVAQAELAVAVAAVGQVDVEIVLVFIGDGHDDPSFPQ